MNVREWKKTGNPPKPLFWEIAKLAVPNIALGFLEAGLGTSKVPGLGNFGGGISFRTKTKDRFIAIGDDEKVIVIRRADEPPINIPGYEIVKTVPV